MSTNLIYQNSWQKVTCNNLNDFTMSIICNNNLNNHLTYPKGVNNPKRVFPRTYHGFNNSWWPLDVPLVPQRPYKQPSSLPFPPRHQIIHTYYCTFVSFEHLTTPLYSLQTQLPCQQTINHFSILILPSESVSLTICALQIIQNLFLYYFELLICGKLFSDLILKPELLQ